MPGDFRSPAARDLTAAVSTGGRTIFAVGDIHGRLDLLGPLLEKIGSDLLAAPAQDIPVLVFLGDYVDRGPSSKGVVDRVIATQKTGDLDVRTLKGNHEAALLQFLDDAAFGPVWCEQGGAQTLLSYGVAAPRLRTDLKAWDKSRHDFLDTLPADHLRFYQSLETILVYGDYVFVHAGLRPAIPLHAQSEHDLLWIRRDFLDANHGFEKIVVHGHTPQTAPFLGDHRIGIDTGAYATSVLTAVRLSGTERRIVQVKASEI